jgi:hypothetical protein
MKKYIHIIFDADSFWSKMILTIIYLFVYDYLFHDFIFEQFGYFGVEYQPMSILTMITWVTISIIPVSFYHGVVNISSYITFFLYLFVYIPFIHAIFVIPDISFLQKDIVSIVVCALFILYMNIGKHIKLLKDINITPKIPFKYIEVLTILLSVIYVAANINRMHFVNIFTQQDVLYDLRAQNSEEIGEGNIFTYLRGWLFGAFYPFLLVDYLKNKKWVSTLCILFGYIILFMVDMQKLTFLMPFALTALYFLIKLNIHTICNRLHSFIIGFLILLSLVLMNLQENKIVFTVASILILRTICVTGWLTQTYFLFFNNGNPFTHYSHINIVNMLTNNYPYDVPLGVAVSYHSQNANATFLLTDGYAAWGIFGIVIIGIIFYLFLEFANSISYNYKLEDLLVLFLPTVSYLLNVSFFTTLLSNGLLFLLILIACTDTTKKENNKECL